MRTRTRQKEQEEIAASKQRNLLLSSNFLNEDYERVKSLIGSSPELS